MKKTGKLNLKAQVDKSFRSKAEEALKRNPVESGFEKHDLVKSIHELEVHKVELEMMNEELLRSKSDTETVLSKLKLALETGKIGLWEMDLNNDDLTLDKSSEKIFGLQRGMSNYPRKIEDLVSEEDLIHFRKIMNIALLHNIPFETVFRSSISGNTSKFINAKAEYKSNGKNSFGILSGVFFDISGLKENSEKLIATLNEDLLRSNTDLQNFAYIASHDLQEPLRMVTSFTQLLQQQYKDKLDDKANEYIGYAVEGAKRMYDLLNGLLSYSRINSRGHDFNDIDMNSILELVKNNLHFQIKENGVEIKSEKLPVITADWNQMLQLMQNLISNSIKFCDGNPVINISAKKENNDFIFMVRDNGIGIDPRFHDRIFQMFQRLYPREKYVGIGIGLAICKRIVERHRGRIWVESQPGIGSSFFFTIPEVRRKAG